MSDMPDLPTATRDAARWDLEFALDPAGNAVAYSSSLNTLAIIQGMNDMPDAAVASFIKAAEVAAHPGIADRRLSQEIEGCALFNVIPALLRQGQAERALDFAERMIELEAGEYGTASGRGIALQYKADCLQQLGRAAEELTVRIDALSEFALAEHSDAAPEFGEVTTTHTARRIAELMEREDG